jgi:hypothetical protein
MLRPLNRALVVWVYENQERPVSCHFRRCRNSCVSSPAGASPRHVRCRRLLVGVRKRRLVELFVWPNWPLPETPAAAPARCDAGRGRRDRRRTTQPGLSGVRLDAVPGRSHPAGKARRRDRQLWQDFSTCTGRLRGRSAIATNRQGAVRRWQVIRKAFSESSRLVRTEQSAALKDGFPRHASGLGRWSLRHQKAPARVAPRCPQSSANRHWQR